MVVYIYKFRNIYMYIYKDYENYIGIIYGVIRRLYILYVWFEFFLMNMKKFGFSNCFYFEKRVYFYSFVII